MVSTENLNAFCLTPSQTFAEEIGRLKSVQTKRSSNLVKTFCLCSLNEDAIVAMRPAKIISAWMPVLKRWSSSLTQPYDNTLYIISQLMLRDQSHFIQEFLEECAGPETTVELLQTFFEAKKQCTAIAAFCVLLPLCLVPAGEAWLTKNYHRIVEHYQLFSACMSVLEKDARPEEPVYLDINKLKTIWRRFQHVFDGIRATESKRHEKELLAQEEKEKANKQRKIDKKKKRNQMRQVVDPKEHENIVLPNKTNTEELDNRNEVDMDEFILEETADWATVEPKKSKFEKLLSKKDLKTKKKAATAQKKLPVAEIKIKVQRLKQETNDETLVNFRPNGGKPVGTNATKKNNANKDLAIAPWHTTKAVENVGNSPGKDFPKLSTNGHGENRNQNANQYASNSTLEGELDDSLKEQTLVETQDEDLSDSSCKKMDSRMCDNEKDETLANGTLDPATQGCDKNSTKTLTPSQQSNLEMESQEQKTVQVETKTSPPPEFSAPVEQNEPNNQQPTKEIKSPDPPRDNAAEPEGESVYAPACCAITSTPEKRLQAGKTGSPNVAKLYYPKCEEIQATLTIDNKLSHICVTDDQGCNHSVPVAEVTTISDTNLVVGLVPKSPGKLKQPSDVEIALDTDSLSLKKSQMVYYPREEVVESEIVIGNKISHLYVNHGAEGKEMMPVKVIQKVYGDKEFVVMSHKKGGLGQPATNSSPSEAAAADDNLLGACSSNLVPEKASELMTPFSGGTKVKAHKKRSRATNTGPRVRGLEEYFLFSTAGDDSSEERFRTAFNDLWPNDVDQSDTITQDNVERTDEDGPTVWEAPADVPVRSQSHPGDPVDDIARDAEIQFLADCRLQESGSIKADSRPNSQMSQFNVDVRDIQFGFSSSSETETSVTTAEVKSEKWQQHETADVRQEHLAEDTTENVKEEPKGKEEVEPFSHCHEGDSPVQNPESRPQIGTKEQNWPSLFENCPLPYESDYQMDSDKSDITQPFRSFGAVGDREWKSKPEVEDPKLKNPHPLRRGQGDCLIDDTESDASDLFSASAQWNDPSFFGLGALDEFSQFILAQIDFTETNDLRQVEEKYPTFGKGADYEKYRKEHLDKCFKEALLYAEFTLTQEPTEEPPEDLDDQESLGLLPRVLLDSSFEVDNVRFASTSGNDHDMWLGHQSQAPGQHMQEQAIFSLHQIVNDNPGFPQLGMPLSNTKPCCLLEHMFHQAKLHELQMEANNKLRHFESGKPVYQNGQGDSHLRSKLALQSFKPTVPTSEEVKPNAGKNWAPPLFTSAGSLLGTTQNVPAFAQAPSTEILSESSDRSSRASSTNSSINSFRSAKQLVCWRPNVAVCSDRLSEAFVIGKGCSIIRTIKSFTSSDKF